MVVLAVARPATSQVDPRPEKRPGIVSEVAGALVIEAPRAHFDDQYQFATVTHRFPFRNRGDEPVVIEQTLALAPGGAVEAAPRVVPPGGAGEIVVRQSLAGALGLVTFRYALVTDEPGVSRYRVLLSGFVQSAYEPEHADLDFGVVDCATGGMRALELLSREVARLEVAEISGVPDGARVRIDERAGDTGEGVRIRVELPPGGLLGARSGRFRLRTNVPHQPEFEVSFRANVFCDLVPAENPVVLGLGNEGVPLSREVELVSRAGRPVEIDRAVDPTLAVATQLLACAEERPSCVTLRLAVDNPVKGGLNGTVLVYAKGAEEPVPLGYTGMIVGAEKAVKKVEILDPASDAAPPPRAEARAEARAVPAPRPHEGSGAAATAAATASPPPAAAGGTVPQAVLKWVTREETEVYGYLVYRAVHREGPFTRVNAQVVPAAGREGGPHSYEFIDRDVEVGTTYYYYLDLVTRSGAKKRFSGVVQKRIQERTRDAATNPTPVP